MTQDRATARKRDRNLLSMTLAFVEQFEPEMIVSENVANIETGASKQIWEGFRTQLYELYDTGVPESVLPNSGYRSLAAVQYS